MITITNLTIKPKSHDDIRFFYANLIFKVDNEAEYLKSYLENSQKEYIKRRVYKTYQSISGTTGLSSDGFDSFEDLMEQFKREIQETEYYEGWDFNPSSGWFIYIPKFDCWRLHEYFTDNAITRGIFDHIQKISYNMPTYSRTTHESELISCFESLKYWWD